MISRMLFGYSTAAIALTAIVVNLWLGVGPAILVLAAGVLLATIASFWISLRTLTGDAPLPVDLMIVARMAPIEDAENRKRALLRTLKDLEHEHAIGKLSDADYAELADTYRNHVKTVMREMDETLDPLRKRAEAIAESHLKKRGLPSKTTDEVKPTDAV